MRRKHVLPMVLVLACSFGALGDEGGKPREAALGSDEKKTSAAVVRIGVLSENAEKTVTLLEQVSSKLPELALLERQQVDSILKEQGLQMRGVLDAGGVKQRIALGKIIKADLLILVSSETSNRNEQMRLAIADTRQGVRLWSQDVLIDQEHLEKGVDSLVTVLQHALATKQKGIRAVFSIFPMASKALSFESDALALVVSSALRDSLLLHEGIITVEFEEAQALQAECDLAGEGAQGRVLSPLMVQGSIQIEGKPGATSDRNLVVSLDVAKLKGQPKRVEARMGRTPEDIMAGCGRLAQPLISDALGTETQARAADIRKEVESLLAHAAVLLKDGAWEGARQTTEAVIFLDPGNLAARTGAMKAYGQLAATCPIDDQNLSESWNKRLRLLERGAVHAEWITRTQANLPYEAGVELDMFLRKGLVWMSVASLEGRTRISDFEQADREYISKVMHDLRVVAGRMIVRNVALFKKCPYANMSYMREMGVGGFCGTDRWVEGPWKDKADLVLGVIRDTAKARSGVPAEEINLKEHLMRLVGIYAEDIGRLVYSHERTKYPRDRDKRQAHRYLIQEITALKDPFLQAIVDTVESNLDGADLPPVDEPPSPRSTVAPVKVALPKRPASGNERRTAQRGTPPPRLPPSGRRVEDTLLWQLKPRVVTFKNSQTGQVIRPAGVLEITGYGELGDLLYTYDGIFLVREPGVAMPINFGKKEKLNIAGGVEWDGEVIWTSTLERNVYAWNSRTGEVREWGPDQGIPKNDTQKTLSSNSHIMTVPFESNLLVVVSSHMVQGAPRTWIGLVNYNKPDVVTLWEAKGVPSGKVQDPEEVTDPTLGFHCEGTSYIPPATPGERGCMLLERGHGRSPLTVRLNPFEIKAGEMASRARETRRATSMYIPDGEIKGFFTADGYRYIWGSGFFRVDLTNDTVETLVKPARQSDWLMVDAMGASRHYGILAWSRWTEEFYSIDLSNVKGSDRGSSRKTEGKDPDRGNPKSK